MDNKIKVLFIPSDTFGTGHFRCIWPAQTFVYDYSEEFYVDINSMPDVNNIEYFKQYDIIHFHRHIGNPDTYKTLFPVLKQAGITLIMDVDDYWDPPQTHPLYDAIKKEGLTQKIIEAMQVVDYVTTTTDIAAEYIKKYNKNVIVIPNAINMKEKMWASEAVPSTSGKSRIAWIGGSSHKYDLDLLEKSMALLHSNNELKNKFQILTCGFDTRGTVTEFYPNGTQKPRALQPHETIWLKFEQILSSNFSGIKTDAEYMKWLNKIAPGNYPEEYDKNYVRRWTLPLTQYAKHYDYCDICLAPLAEWSYNQSPKGQVIKEVNHFNLFKSELKIIEAGMKKKALIVQDIGIYKKLLENGKTGFLIPSDEPDGWYKAMRKLILNPDLVKELSENLHNFVKDRYDIKIVTKHRAEFYRNIIKEKATKKEAELVS